jgi:hypothetical protein
VAKGVGEEEGRAEVEGEELEGVLVGGWWKGVGFAVPCAYVLFGMSETI